jgi:hypothetical protein|mmetsp:Transcript_37960/g.63024  ORF Transcript_37960/g.63024 Transcript_37960/m.63024 type:complete len:86 (+) Transcript_37960:371-628(+)
MLLGLDPKTKKTVMKHRWRRAVGPDGDDQIIMGCEGCTNAAYKDGHWANVSEKMAQDAGTESKGYETCGKWSLDINPWQTVEDRL